MADKFNILDDCQDAPEAPEVEEFQRKQSELEKYKSALADRELELVTIRAELKEFELYYKSVVGEKYAILDDLEAKIAELESERLKGDREVEKKAQEARSKANRSAHESNKTQEKIRGHKRPFSPSQEIKAMYRKLALLIHPDHTTDPKDKEKRHLLMSELNEAYANGDEERIQSIFTEWKFSPDLIDGEGIEDQLVRIIRKIAQIKRRLKDVEDEVVNIKKSELYQLMDRVNKAKQQGKDLIKEMIEKIMHTIKQKQEIFERLQR